VLVDLSQLTVSQMTAVSTDESHHQRCTGSQSTYSTGRRWRDRIGAPALAALHGLDEPVVGPDGFTMPATQNDAVLWLAGAAYDVIFDEARAAIAALAALADVAGREN
jgi:hypothetical protein